MTVADAARIMREAKDKSYQQFPLGGEWANYLVQEVLWAHPYSGGSRANDCLQRRQSPAKGMETCDE